MKRLLILAAAVIAFAAPVFATNVTTLDAPAGGGWKIVRDPTNRGMIDRWQRAVPHGAVDIRVPGTLQEAFPGYWGLVWYYRPLQNIKKRDDARYLLRFRMAAYKATVYMNGVELGSHEDSEEIFTLDATDAVKDGENLIAVRLLCPDIVEIDGINTYEIPGRGKGRSMYNYGGLLDSVEFLETPTVRMTDIRLIPDAKYGCVEIRGKIDNPTGETREGKVTFRIMPAHEGEVCDETAVNITAAPGESDFSLMLYVKNRKLWDIDDPNLYCVSGESDFDGSALKDSYSSNIGFRIFEYKDGFFKLNGRRIFLKCNHCDEMSPVGLTVPLNKEMTRRDMMNFKTMGFNCVRFIFGLHHSYILDLADELGLMIYDEALASWQLGYNMQNPEPKIPAMVPRWEYSTLNMIRRDRNHPSVVIWGMLNENYSDVFYRRALTFLPEVRKEDDSRFVLLNSGNFHLTDFVVPLTGDIKMGSPLSVPHIHKNPSTEILTNADTHLPPGKIQMHPAPEKDCSVRFTAPKAGKYDIKARFVGICDRPTSSEPMIYVKGEKVFDDFINLRGKGNECAYEGSFDLDEGDLVFVNVGCGDGESFSDATVVDLTIGDYNLFDDYNGYANPRGVWTYGEMLPGELGSFARFAGNWDDNNPAVYANPGEDYWRSDLDDIHPYRDFPHRENVLKEFRTTAPRGYSVFASEYGIGSAINLTRVVRGFEGLGRTDAGDAKFFVNVLNAFMKDWDRLGMERTFASPDDYFDSANALMARCRLFGMNALRANPKMIGYSLTAGHDISSSGEGLVTYFREPKKGTHDAVFDGFSPCRWCAFVEPMNVRNTDKVKISGVLVNEDVLRPGTYNARVTVFGEGVRLYDETIPVTVKADS
ncbi:MAG: glycoside hydrolase family 2, partial [Abditibacteriota bacterium]|nr:glycoside hydrolase family 2 [Abditibacteriota bacterium]